MVSSRDETSTGPEGAQLVVVANRLPVRRVDVYKRQEVPIAATYPLEQVQQAFRELEQGHTLGKIVLHP